MWLSWYEYNKLIRIICFTNWYSYVYITSFFIDSLYSLDKLSLMLRYCCQTISFSIFYCDASIHVYAKKALSYSVMTVKNITDNWKQVVFIWKDLLFRVYICLHSAVIRAGLVQLMRRYLIHERVAIRIIWYIRFYSREICRSHGRLRRTHK